LPQEPPKEIEHDEQDEIECDDAKLQLAQEKKLHEIFLENEIKKEKLQQLEETKTKCCQQKLIWTNLQNCWTETKSQCLGQVVDFIQNKVNEICCSLFHSPIIISLVAQNKKIEILFSYKQRTMGVTDLSGGEKSRVSIAFSCALAELKSSKLVMLDESLAGLDVQNMVGCIEFLKEWSKQTKIPILVVAHDAATGLFDKTINLQTI
jgi:translation initiation factor RLI1